MSSSQQNGGQQNGGQQNGGQQDRERRPGETIMDWQNRVSAIPTIRKRQMTEAYARSMARREAERRAAEAPGQNGNGQNGDSQNGANGSH
ncbi:hypothetical protein DHEL01_v203555 [Diaporthe helianthi]|uniref:Uncharacterized protein n=1 Tax=Diaporthe helianthi TaxID=158607 RepID=A0A2P5I6B9_DIAHE|nr:hypothetical protein DHEL01_v203555 [Diaporthe helianthi]